MGRKSKQYRQKAKALQRAQKDDEVKANGERQGPGYKDIIKENANFEKYYKLQGIVPEDEWDTFMDKIRENLPAAFRITGYKKQAKALLNIIRGTFFDNFLNIKIEGEVIEKPLCLPWYPDNLAWQLNLSRIIIRKSEELSKLHNFLVSETASGNISRQETVSMIPPLLLDVQPHHKVLDMCAAPGSKTSQIIEMLHRDEGKIPEGVVVANDVDNKRCYMLVHQAKRLQSPSFIVTNHDACNLPNFRVKKTDGSEGYDLMKFDRVLCDVPCSGDGTIRKNIDVWTKWNAANGNNLHGIQVRVVTRGLEMLAEGGRLVYSTCSMNPIEDEAVITTILQKCKGTVELVEVSLPGLKSTKGVYTWKVTNRHLDVYETFEDVPQSFSTQIRLQMFPPSLEEAKEMKLERCLRILPHHQDTGGFFVAVLRKKCDSLPWEVVPTKTPHYLGPDVPTSPNSEEPVPTNNDDNNRDGRSRSPPRKKKKISGFKEDPYIFLKDDDEGLKQIKSFFEIDSSFPTNQLLCRNFGKNRNLYFVSKSAKDIIEGNSERLKIINTGMRMFCKCDNKDAKCIYRFCQEGTMVILPFLKNRKLTVGKDDLILLLTEEYPDITKFSQSVQEQVRADDPGCVVLIHSFNDGTTDLEIVLCGWSGKNSLRCYVAKIERIHYLRLAGVDVTELEKREKKVKKTAEKDETIDELVKAEENSEKDEAIDGFLNTEENST